MFESVLVSGHESGCRSGIRLKLPRSRVDVSPELDKVGQGHTDGIDKIAELTTHLEDRISCVFKNDE